MQLEGFSLLIGAFEVRDTCFLGCVIPHPFPILSLRVSTSISYLITMCVHIHFPFVHFFLAIRLLQKTSEAFHGRA